MRRPREGVLRPVGDGPDDVEGFAGQDTPHGVIDLVGCGLDGPPIGLRVACERRQSLTEMVAQVIDRDRRQIGPSPGCAVRPEVLDSRDDDLPGELG